MRVSLSETLLRGLSNGKKKMATTARWAIEALPFIWGAQSTPNNGNGVPNELPFVLSYDKMTGRVIQTPSSVVADCLANVYELGSILGSNVDEIGAGRQYADDFLEFISEWVQKTPECSRQSLLEIGCGNGYMLDRLRGSFTSVIGIEPGPQGQSGAERYGIEVIKDFFPSPQLHGLKFSAIVLMSVFEHVDDPVALAAMLGDYLEPGGRIFVSVPDEGPYIRNFDVSTLFHEHWSLFRPRHIAQYDGTWRSGC
ncbi:class I SAM-dependent methyltransferase [Devosia algicola]|uniref:Class I SAM-dependent methyltransferase n=1 Tax=Devosia algicola TaxID=3026418 RepID=A0ABY7YT22_9HYPH|nr:class I SAM-dependent methyltransferase [Devosia algicola]WDR04352.1 class I SAM-dependent methyltransferase [Devosia algicola]